MKSSFPTGRRHFEDHEFLCGRPQPPADSGSSSAAEAVPDAVAGLETARPIPCPHCSKVILISANQCPHCGTVFYDPATESGKKRSTFVLLALTLGLFGIHDFYLGFRKLGRLHLYLLLLPVVGWIISYSLALWELFTTNEDFFGDPLL